MGVSPILRPGDLLTGTVAAIERFGVFVALDDGPPHPVFLGTSASSPSPTCREWHFDEISRLSRWDVRSPASSSAWTRSAAKPHLLERCRARSFPALLHDLAEGQEHVGTVTKLAPFRILRQDQQQPRTRGRLTRWATVSPSGSPRSTTTGGACFSPATSSKPGEAHAVQSRDIHPHRGVRLRVFFTRRAKRKPSSGRGRAPKGRARGEPFMERSGPGEPTIRRGAAEKREGGRPLAWKVRGSSPSNNCPFSGDKRRNSRHAPRIEQCQ